MTWPDAVFLSVLAITFAAVVAYVLWLFTGIPQSRERRALRQQGMEIRRDQYFRALQKGRKS